MLTVTLQSVVGFDEDGVPEDRLEDVITNLLPLDKALTYWDELCSDHGERSDPKWCPNTRTMFDDVWLNGQFYIFRWVRYSQTGGCLLTVSPE